MRVRLRFHKIGKIRFVGHRDVARIFERALRKIGFPVTYSEGFSPRVKMSFGLALPTCYESRSEFLDIPIDDQSLVDGRLTGIGQGEGATWSPGELADALTDALPDGIGVDELVIEPRGGPSLQEAIHACTWQFDIMDCTHEAAVAGVERVLGSDIVVVARSKKGTMVEEDVRPAIHELYVDAMSERGAVIVARLSATPRVVRPSELLEALAPGHEMGVARRLHQWIESEGARHEPLSPATADSHLAASAGSQEGIPS